MPRSASFVTPSPRSPPLALIRHTRPPTPIVLLFASTLLLGLGLAGAVSAQEPLWSDSVDVESAAAETEASASETEGAEGAATQSAEPPSEDVGEATPDPAAAATEARAADETAAYTMSEAAYASDGTPEREPSRLPAASHYQVGFTHQFETDVADGGSFHMWSGFLDATYDVHFTDRWAAVTIFDYRADVYEFDDAPLVGGFALLQWGVIHTPRLEMLGAYEIGDWRIYLGPVLEFSFEGGANIREAFRPGGAVAAEWTINEDLRVGLGVVAVAELDEGAYVSPILLLDWNLTDALALHMESWTTRGGELELGWRAIDQLELAASVGFRREYYRLNERDDGAPAPGPNPIPINEGLVRDRAYTTAVRVSWLPQLGFVKDVFGDLRVDLDAAVALGGSFTIEDELGNRLSKQDYDAAPSIGLKFHVPF